MRKQSLSTALLVLYTLLAMGEPLFKNLPLPPESTLAADTLRWALSKNGGIVWDVNKDIRLPHQDHVEMSGRQVSIIAHYQVGSKRDLTLKREIYWPMLHTAPQPGEPDWAKYRAYLKRSYGEEVNPDITVDGKKLALGAVSKVNLNGLLTFTQAAGPSLIVKRTLFPSMHQAAVLEQWELTNTGKSAVRVTVAPLQRIEKAAGIEGTYQIETWVKPVQEASLLPGKKLLFGMLCNARKESEPLPDVNIEAEKRIRQQFVQTVTQSLVLATPDVVLNRAFEMAKIRASESLFETKAGLVHSPGGGRYYGGVWANDQVEYAGPFFPFMGYEPANLASLNAYRIFAKDMKPDYHRIWSSYEMGAALPCCSKDRGDAAMYAYGASRFALASGNRKVAEELWPAVAWSLEYCRRRTNDQGIVESESDEMEGRLPTGKANLSTSTLAYGGLRSGADLARSLGQTDSAAVYETRAQDLKQAIEKYFGATVEGFLTYQYFEGHDTLRHWICLPLTMGILERKEGTIQALFTKLWTANGLDVQPGANSFWDRGTLYALRGAFNAGETTLALQYLQAYTHQRLLGNHVPYPVEAYPEGGQAHLSAESALYGRIVTEGMFGVVPTGLHAFRCTPHLPQEWPFMRLNRIKAFGEVFDLSVKREANNIRLQVLRQGKPVFSQTRPAGSSFEVSLRP